jgi:hypothetical protein
MQLSKGGGASVVSAAAMHAAKTKQDCSHGTALLHGINPGKQQAVVQTGIIPAGL